MSRRFVRPFSQSSVPTSDDEGDERNSELHPRTDRYGLEPKNPYANDDDPGFRASLSKKRAAINAKTRLTKRIPPILLGLLAFIGVSALLFPELVIGFGVTPLFLIAGVVPCAMMILMAMTLSRLQDLEHLIEQTSSRIDHAQDSTHEIDDIMVEFQHDISSISKEFQNNRAILATQLSLIKSSLDHATALTARVVDEKVNSLGQQIKSDLKDTSVEDKILSQGAQVSNQISQLEVQLKSLSNAFVQSGQESRDDFKKSISQIGDLIANLTATLSSTQDDLKQKQFEIQNEIVDEIKTLKKSIADIPKLDPQSLAIDFEVLASSVEGAVDKAMQAATTPVTNLLKTAIQSQASLAETMTALPSKIDDYMSGVAPSIAAGIHEHSRRSEARIIDTIKQSFNENEALTAQHIAAYQKTNQNIAEIDQHIASEFEKFGHSLAGFTSSLPDAIRVQFEMAIQGKIKLFALDLKRSIEDGGEQNALDVAHLKIKLDQIYETVQRAIAEGLGKEKEINRSKSELETLMRAELHPIIQSLDQLPSQLDTTLNRVLKATDDMPSRTQTPDLSVEQRKLIDELSAIEERLFKSLQLFNHTIENQTRVLMTPRADETMTSDQGSISKADDHLETVRAEIENLTSEVQSEKRILGETPDLYLEATKILDPVLNRAAILSDKNADLDPKAVELFSKKRPRFNTILDKMTRR